jgi:hypothetical protein
MAGKPFDGMHGRRADVMLHAFDIVINDVGREAEKLEEVGQELMAVGDVTREFLARRREHEAAVFLVFEQAVGIEFLNHVGDASLGNGETPGDVDHARVTLGVDELEDLLEVILDGRGGWALGGSGGMEGGMVAKGGREGNALAGGCG